MRAQTMVMWTFRMQHRHGTIKRFAADNVVGNAPAALAALAPRPGTLADPARRRALLSLHHH